MTDAPRVDASHGELLDVVIAGYGPTGATMANLLGQRGWRVAVVERSAEPYDKPRAITADHEALRVFQEVGLAEAITDGSSAHPGTDFVGVQGQVIKRFYPAPPPHPLGWLPNWMFEQPRLEAVLREGVRRYAQVEVLLEHEFLDFEQAEDSVAVRVCRLADGEQRVLHARYLLACDGARSTARRLVDGATEDLAFDEWWLVVDMWQRGPVSLPSRCVQYCRPSRPATYIQGPGLLRRWEIKLLPGETPEDFDSEAAVLRVLAGYVETTSLELCRRAVYRFHALVAEDWHLGRVLLMGDAAHQMPPFLGQGMCAGIRDTVNLAWKLDAVLRGSASASLLDTYGEERKRHVRTVVGHAKSFGLIIGELGEDAARERDRRLEAELASGEAETVRQRFTPGLETGLIARTADAKPARGAGELFPQPWIRTGAAQTWQRMDDVTGSSFRMILRDAQLWHELSGRLRAAWQSLGGSVWVLAGTERMPAHTADGVPAEICERDGLLADCLRHHDACALVVRPDHYVYGAAANAVELAALVEGLREACADGESHVETGLMEAA